VEARCGARRSPSEGSTSLDLLAVLKSAVKGLKGEGSDHTEPSVRTPVTCDLHASLSSLVTS
jgi:hypothetical protein